MEYPFEFKEMILTGKALTALGYTEYWAGCGDFGERKFGVRINENQFDINYGIHTIVEMDEKEDDADGYGAFSQYSPRIYCNSFKNNLNRNIYFLHDLYEDIAENAPKLLDLFIEQTKKKGVNMYPYIESYLKFKESIKTATTNSIVI